MSKQLHILLDEDELADIQRIARSRQMTVAEWVRQVLRAARQSETSGDAARKIEVIRAAARHSGPTADIGQMLSEIERGYLGGT